MSTIQDDIRAVLERAARGKLPRHASGFLTVYQILERLPPLVRSDLLARYGVPGKHAKKRYTAATALAQVLGGMGDVSVDYLDTKDLGLTVAKTEIQAGYQVCALYRLTSRSP